MPNSQPLIKLLRSRIASHRDARLSFAEFMDLALYHPQYGYYSSGIVEIGAQGDYFTSPSLGADFGELLAEQFHQMWQTLGCPEPFVLVEMGAGQGLLAGDILNYLQCYYPNCFACLEYIIIEQAAALIDRQQQQLAPWKEAIAISWKSWDELADNSIIGCCFANELVDAFPVHRVVIEDGELREIYVSLSDLGEAFDAMEVSAEPSTPQLGQYFNDLEIALPSSAYPEGYRTEVNLAAIAWLQTVSSKLQRGYLLTIDYGYPAWKYYHPQRQEGTLQCYWQHRRHNDPYFNLGYQDITAHVDFSALETYGERYELFKLGLTQQGVFLMALGLGDRLVKLSDGSYQLNEILQRRDALHQLIDPTGLGGFYVLIQGKGLSDREKNQPLRGLTQPTF